MRDRSTFAEPTLTAEGIIHVMVNGRFVIENGKTNRRERPGRVLRRPGSAGQPNRAEPAPTPRFNQGWNPRPTMDLESDLYRAVTIASDRRYWALASWPRPAVRI